MQKSFATLFDQKVSVLGASRTDAGVHALGQVATFWSNRAIESATLKEAWNNILPTDIVIRSLEQVDQAFHPHHNIKHKTYYYHFFTARPLPFVTRYGWYYRYPVDLDTLRNALEIFLGAHNFRAFCTGEPIGGDPTSTITHINIEFFKRFGMYRITMTGRRFLRHMVRRLIGAALDVAAKRVSLIQMKNVFEAKDPNNALPTAPAKGLLLYKIVYKDNA